MTLGSRRTVSESSSSWCRRADGIQNRQGWTLKRPSNDWIQSERGEDTCSYYLFHQIIATMLLNVKTIPFDPSWFVSFTYDIRVLYITYTYTYIAYLQKKMIPCFLFPPDVCFLDSFVRSIRYPRFVVGHQDRVVGYSTAIDSPPTRTEVHPFLPFRMYHFETQCISWNKIRSDWRVGWLFHSSFSSAPGSHSTSIPGTRLESNWIESRIDSTPPYVSIPAAEIACSRATYRR